jgi:hypothetical protein
MLSVHCSKRRRLIQRKAKGHERTESSWSPSASEKGEARQIHFHAVITA